MVDKAHNEEYGESKVSDFFALLKPRVMSLVVFSGFVGVFLAPGNIHPLLAFITIFCIAIGSGASGAINMWYERDLDAKMDRTKKRPLPDKRMHPDEALNFSMLFAISSVVILGLAVNLISASILAFAILYYVFIYTVWLKTRTAQNIVIGGAAGAFPPIIGWSAVTGEISLDAVILFLIIFIWTPSHFWALSLYKSDDYANAGIPMLPVVAGDEVTKKHIVSYSILLFMVSLLPCLTGLCEVLYLVSAIILGAIYLFKAYKLLDDKKNKMAPSMFAYSIFYLFALFSFMILDKLLR